MRDVSTGLRRSTRNIKKRFEVLPPKTLIKKVKKEKNSRVKNVKISSAGIRRSERLNSKNSPSKKEEIPEMGVMKSIAGVKKQDSVIDWSTWKSASSTKNFMMDDGFLDVLQYKSSSVIKADANYSKDIGQMIASANNTTGFVASLLNYGNLFENRVVDLLKKELNAKNTVYIGGNPRSDLQYQKTIDEMKKGTPIIFQANLRNYDNQTYGVSDIVIRSDWINRFLDVNALTPEEEVKKAPLLKGKYHYVVIDIKYKSLPLRSDGIHLRNDGNMKAYKSQLLIYRDAVAKIQGYVAPYAFILGSKWKYTKNGQEFEGKGCFERLGKIDYSNLDSEYIEKTKAALQWLKDVRENDYDLSKYPLPRQELYPNMCNHHDFPYHNIKKTFAEKNNDLTLLWNVGPKQRRFANSQGVFDWKDKNCTPETLGVNGEKRAKVLSRILEANHSEVRNIYPKYIENNFGGWKENKGLELYVDFETTCSVFRDMDELPFNNGTSLIFLIGAGYIHPKTGNWIYEKFIVDQISEKEESRICIEFVNFIEKLKRDFKVKTAKVWHYSGAEPSCWRRFEKRNREYFVNWTDLLKVFMVEPIGIKDVLSYGLKSVTKALHAHGYIQTNYDESSIGGGSDAAIGAFRANLECGKNGSSFAHHEIATEIIKYNEIDCKVLMEILSYLRKNHVEPVNKKPVNKKTANKKPVNKKRKRNL